MLNVLIEILTENMEIISFSYTLIGEEYIYEAIFDDST